MAGRVATAHLCPQSPVDVGVYWAQVEREGFNPLTGERVMAQRRILRPNLELPIKEEYRAMIFNLLPPEEEER